MKFLIFAVLTAVSGSSFGFSSIEFSSQGEQQCFAKAMVGMDSVINSRLGVPPEHALELSATKPVSLDDAPYSNSMLKVILSAYLWNDSPHSYAMKVFYRCAAENAPLYSAKSDH